MALGANCWNMAFYGCFAGYYLIWKPIMKSNLFSKSASEKAMRLKIAVASILGCVITLQLGAFSVVLETKASGITELPFGAFVGLMQPIHLAIGVVEGLITSAVLVFVYEARPELLTLKNDDAEKGKMSIKGTIAVLAILAIVTGGVFSHFASANPDGLEWTLFGNKENGYSANLSLDEDNYGISSSVSEVASGVVEKTAILPDYAFKNSESPVGTSVSGILGTALVAAFAVAICFAGKFFRKNRINR